jgi:hypothetical protein
MFLVQTHEVPVNPCFITSERGETGEPKETSCVCIGQHPGIFTDFFPHTSHFRRSQLEADDREWNCRSMGAALNSGQQAEIFCFDFSIAVFVGLMALR